MNWPWMKKTSQRLKQEQTEAKTGPLPTRVVIGHGFIAQQMINDKWILFHEKEPDRAFDLKNHSFKWSPGASYYLRDCMADSLDDILKNAKNILASQGVFKDQIDNASLPPGRISGK